MAETTRARLKRHIKKNLPYVATIIGLVLLAAVTTGYILYNQRVRPPWQDNYRIKAEFSDATAVTAGQGQTVNIAGIPVGLIAGVRLKDGRAVVEMTVRKQYGPIYRDATMSLRPRTALKDMYVELDPGNRSSGVLPEGEVLGVSRTEPNIDPDTLLAQLDPDTRNYLKLLISGLGGGLEGNSRHINRLLHQFEPTTASLAKLNGAVEERRVELAQLVHDLGTLSEAVAQEDRAIARLVDQSATTFSAFAQEDESLRESVRRLAPTLLAAERTLDKTRVLGRELAPAARALKEPARELAPALQKLEPFLSENTPVLRDKIRPLVREARPLAADARRAAKPLRAAVPQLKTVFSVVNELTNELAYNPAGPDEGFLFWLSWFGHNADSMLSTQDANGAVWRGQVFATCTEANLAKRALPDLARLVGFNGLAC